MHHCVRTLVGGEVFDAGSLPGVHVRRAGLPREIVRPDEAPGGPVAVSFPVFPSGTERAMRWTPGGRSENIEDERGSSGGGGGPGFGRIGIVGVILAVVIGFATGRNPLEILGLMQQVSGGAPQVQASAPAPVNDPAEEPIVQFVSFVLDSTQATWRKTLEAEGRPYRDAKLVLFRDQVTSACGQAGASTGPFYCPGDEKVYIDLSFFRELDTRFGAPGDFAQAYVIAHELGHHVQKLLGTSDKVARLQQQRPDLANQASVRLELQADCYAGIWGHAMQQRNILEPGDVQEGLNAAAAVGDDRLQKQAQGYVVPESFTHGSSKQRMEWFERGFKDGALSACDTFAGR